MINVGHYHTLPVTRVTEAGYMLDAGELGEVLLPMRHATGKLRVGHPVDVFLYLNADDLPVATTQKPKACIGEFAYLKAVSTTRVGAFLDWGLEKDVLVPFAQQHRPMEEGRSYLVYLYLNKVDGRIVATSKIEKVLKDDTPHHFKKGQPVDLIIANSTDLGFKAIINHGHWGVLYESDVHQRLSFGQSIQGYIKHVRPDGKIDLTLQAGQETRDKNMETIISFLREHDGFAALHDKSDPQLIVKSLSMSKGAFKKAIGNLYRQRIISIEDDGIRLLQEPAPAAAMETESVWARAVKAKSQVQPKTEVEVEPEPLFRKSPEQEARIVLLSREPIELYKILKFEGLTGSGGDARKLVADGHVLLNGKVETQKRKKIVSGDVIEFNGETLLMQLENNNGQ